MIEKQNYVQMALWFREHLLATGQPPAEFPRTVEGLKRLGMKILDAAAAQRDDEFKLAMACEAELAPIGGRGRGSRYGFDAR